MQLNFRGLAEAEPGDAWRAVVAHGWPGWSAWFRRKGGAAGPDLRDSRRALARHMPEMLPLLERLVDAADGDEEMARFLCFWTPPRYLINCSQAVVVDSEGPLLIRNYDLDPALNESTMLCSAWRGRRVMGMVEGLSGLADGINDAGLAASLTFGGSAETAPGFGVPLIMRYVLEVADDVAGAVEVLRAVPSHMAYNITLADRSGAAATVFLAPGGGADVTDRRLASNHQPGDRPTPRRQATRTFERERHLEQLLAAGADLAPAFLRPPLFSTDYDRAFGTVYTAAYRPVTGAATLSWRSGPPLAWRIDAFAPAERRVSYSASASNADPSACAPPAPRPAASPEQLAAFFAELAGCLAGRRDWTGLGAIWDEKTAA